MCGFDHDLYTLEDLNLTLFLDMDTFRSNVELDIKQIRVRWAINTEY